MTYAEREKIIEDFGQKELPILLESAYIKYSKKYPKRYIPVGKTHDNKNLFSEIEAYVKKEYDVDFKLAKHFDFHSKLVYLNPTNNFGFSSIIKNNEEFMKLFNEYQGPKYEYSIFDNIYPEKKASRIIQKKLDEDVYLLIQFIKFEIEAYFKRFFILGGYNLFWITIDQLNYYGIDKFPDCLNEEIKEFEYNVNFRLNLDFIGQENDEFGIVTERRTGFEKEKQYLLSLKKRGFDYITYKDVISDYNVKKFNFNNNGDFEINANTKQKGQITIASLNRNKFKLFRSEKYRAFVKKKQDEYVEEIEKKDSYSYTVPYVNFNKVYFNPITFPKKFKLEPADIIKDDSLLHEYLLSYNEPENKIRDLLNLPKIGEGWISETNLFYEIKNHFSEELVIHHGKPKWLGKQHIDIFFPKHHIAIEYQGGQHYYPIEFFGGEEAYVKNKARDEKKKALCHENNCHLIFVNPDYRINDILLEIESKINSIKNIRD